MKLTEKTVFTLYRHTLELPRASYTVDELYLTLRDQTCLDPTEEGTFETLDEAKAALNDAQPRTYVYPKYIRAEIYVLDRLTVLVTEKGDIEDTTEIETVGYSAEAFSEEDEG